MEPKPEEGVELENEEQAAAQALASMTAGYNKQRHIEAEPAPKPVEGEKPSAEAAPEDEQSNEGEGESAAESEPKVEPEAEPAQQAESVEDIIKALKSQVSELNATPGAVRKIYGELGNIQRTLKQLQEQPKTTAGTPSAEVKEAIASAEKVAKEFPELAGPLVAALKLLSTPQQVTASSPPIDVDLAVQEGISRVRKTDAIEALRFDHPDYVTVRSTPEYKAWLESKDAAFRETFTKTWNANIVSKGLTEFKAWRTAQAQAAKAVKTKRLEDAITPKGEGAPTVTSKLPDSAGLMNGYNRVKKSRTASL